MLYTLKVAQTRGDFFWLSLPIVGQRESRKSFVFNEFRLSLVRLAQNSGGDEEI